MSAFQLGFSANGRAWAAIDSLLYVSDDRGGKWIVAWEAPHADFINSVLKRAT